ncbi:tRNA uridine-5-carboxymethylaminomethyl(34) synthesis enzyme MnmG [Anoxynatronum buryatiense]|uniref:tRNA uridine 5-carboxymethylaminomethyl modification enzyme MnmG n=1 Tax=Anoxynatronum buryatiense TaxID=489973 RepID=A0AA45WWB9_9CLOT|nr:tRNA uridine-5-carboxymethylaminomethyl(34) synthesis enzyme MnmG [Anoxynatronum buryatiense]SMP58406.1 tRNA uridine 5-carboxymethylaminomethyl modification enzyme [Anoxynatronum buryatiense]
MHYEAGQYDLVVVGAGHAGCEAALAASRMGMRTLLTTISLDAVALLACNPSIGGTGKGHLVREVDALGGEMGLTIDKTFIQSKMLNTAKGPAVHSLRAQADKWEYQQAMKQVLENQENLDLLQAEVVDLVTVTDDNGQPESQSLKEHCHLQKGKVAGVVTRTGAIYRSQAVILATGVYLKSKVFMGEIHYESGPSGLFPAQFLSEKLRAMGIELRRFKTGTPARVDARTVDFSKMERQDGDQEIVPFSFANEHLEIQQLPCWLSRTTPETKAVIEANLHRSAMYSGQIKSTGVRYCPSIEDKVVKFSDKPSHQFFLEPEGRNTTEMYVQGMSTSMPEEVQLAMYRTMIGLEQVRIMRPGYAIEYDCIDPTQLTLSLEMKAWENLFCAGQFNGSSGYEEAAAQGLMAGINAVLKLKGKAPFILDRSEAYIGVLIDDLVTKGTNEPYRMMTSRAEYRLVLRQDNADTRLTEKSYHLGLATQERYEAMKAKSEAVTNEMNRLQKTILPPESINPLLVKKGSSTVKIGLSLLDALKRPEIDYDDLASVDPQYNAQLSRAVITQCEVKIKYQGYIDKQLKSVEQFRKMEHRLLPPELDYHLIAGLRLEARQKLSQLRPLSLGQASRISGVSPADISVLLVYLEQQRRMKEKGEDV